MRSFPAVPAACLLVSLLLPVPAAGQEGQEPGDGGEAGAQAEAPTEKDLLAEFNKAFKGPDAAARAAAITALGDLSRNLPDKGSSKLLAKTLAKGLDEDELEVRSAAVAQLGHGRDVETVIASFKTFLEGQLKDIDKRITRPDEESKDYVKRGTTVLGNGSRALANYRDDRSVDILASLLRNLRPNTEGNDLATRVVEPIASALLSLGTHDAVEAAVKQTQTFVGEDEYQRPAAKNLHQALAEFATAHGRAPPEYGDNVSVAWHDWFEEGGDELPKKLGKLKEPPASPPEGMEQTSMRDPAPDGAPERP